MLTVVQTIANGFREVHQAFEQLVREAPETSLDWKPAPATNSLAILITHTLGSERQVWHLVTNSPYQRDRSEEFLVQHASKEELLQLLAVANATIDQLAPRINEDALIAMYQRSDGRAQTGLEWLITNYGHAREHLGQAQITQQLFPR